MTFEYAPAPESRLIVSIKPKYGHFIDGKFVNGRNHFATINPATEEVLSQAKNAESISIESRASCKNVPANLPSLKL